MEQPEELGMTDAVQERLQNLLNEGRHAKVHTDPSDTQFPSYYDAEKFRLGQQIFYNNIFSMMMAKLAGLVVLLSVPTVLDVLMYTKQSMTPCKAFRRYMATILHTFVWYEKEPERQKRFLESLRIVKRKHCVAFRKSFEAGLREASQTDMVLAQFGFIGFTLVCTEELAICATYEELDGLVHFWRVIGNVLGIEDKYNLCMETLEETRALCRRILDEIFLPILAKKSKTFDEMSDILLQGLWAITPMIEPQAYTTFTLHLATKAATNNNHSIEIDLSKLSLYSRSLLWLQFFGLKYLLPPKYWWSSFYRAVFNSLMRLSVYLSEHFPYLAYWRFGMKNSHINIFRS